MRLASAVAFSVTLLLTGCGFVRNDTLVGPYRLVAVDILEETSLCWAFKDNNVVCDLLPKGAVFAAGFNDKYIVAAMHPDLRKKSESRYFYLVRDQKIENDEFGDEHVSKFGPYNETQFQAEKKRRGLPEFSIVYDELK